jgi:hypothetical protein
MSFISYLIPRWWTTISCGQCWSSKIVYYAGTHWQTVEKLLSLLCPCFQKLIKLTAQAIRDCSGLIAAVHILSENWKMWFYFPRYGVPIWSLWPNIRFLPSIVAEKNVTKNVHICSMCIILIPTSCLSILNIYAYFSSHFSQ